MINPQGQDINQDKKQPAETSNLSPTAQFVKKVLDPFYLKLEESDIITIANEIIKKGNAVKKEEIEEYSLKCRKLAANEIQKIQNDKIVDTTQTEKISNVLNNFIEKMIANVISTDMAA